MIVGEPAYFINYTSSMERFCWSNHASARSANRDCLIEIGRRFEVLKATGRSVPHTKLIELGYRCGQTMFDGLW
jgi:hypothetical protein